jgi:DNA polymerase-3 subunit epsilon
MTFRDTLRSFFRPQPSSEERADYENLQKKLPDKKTPVEEVTFYVLDIESTGLDPETDRILSLSVIPVQHNEIRIDDMLSLKINQEYYKSESISIHEIMPDKDPKFGISEKEALATFLQMAGAGVWVAHFSDLDQKLIQQTAKRYGLKSIYNPILDTSVLLSRAIDHYRNPEQMPQGSFQLSEVCKHLNIPIEDQHTAEGDALATAILFTKLLKILQKRGVKTLKELL